RLSRDWTPDVSSSALPTHDASVQKALAIFNRHYHAVNGRESVVYPGVFEGLEAFRAKGVKLAVVTNKPTEFTLPLMEKTGLAPQNGRASCRGAAERGT